jgi:hypothetical protein
VSTPNDENPRRGDPKWKRYVEDRPKDDAEREEFKLWRQVHSAGIDFLGIGSPDSETRHAPDSRVAAGFGEPLGLKDQRGDGHRWRQLTARHRARAAANIRWQELRRLGIAPAALPRGFADVLGAERARRLAEMVDDERIRLAYELPSSQQLATRAQHQDTARRTLSFKLMEQVRGLESRHDELLERWAEADHGAVRAATYGDADREIHELIRTGDAALDVANQLERLKTLPGHADTCLEGNAEREESDGRRWAKAYAAQEALRAAVQMREVELDRTRHDLREQTLPATHMPGRGLEFD